MRQKLLVDIGGTLTHKFYLNDIQQMLILTQQQEL
jgi:hypothetical protein